MFWSFLWRAAIFAPTGAWFTTWLTGFVMTFFGASNESMHSAGQVTQVLGISLGLASAYLNAKDVQPPKAA